MTRVVMLDGDLIKFLQEHCKDKAFYKLMYNKYDRNNLTIEIAENGKIIYSNLTRAQAQKVQRLLDKHFVA